MSWTLVVVMLASAAAAPCPVQDGAAPNDRACDCANSTCDPGEYCQNFSSAPCAFPQCRQQVVPQGGQTYRTYSYLVRHLNFMHCSRCDPLDETKCAECDEESVLHDGTCLENTRIFSTSGAFAALDQHGTVTAWGGSSNGGTVPLGGLTGIRSIFSTCCAFAALDQRRHRHGVGGIVLRRQRALRGAHGHPHFLHNLGVRRARPRRHRHGVGELVLRRHRALRGAHGHPQHFPTIRVRRARPRRHRHGVGELVLRRHRALRGAHGHPQHFLHILGVRRARPRRHRHGVGELVLRRHRALRGAHGHPQHFLHTIPRSPRSTKTAPSRRGGLVQRRHRALRGAHGHPQHFLHILGVRRARPRRHRHGVGGIVLRRQRALRGAHGHPQHFLHTLRVRCARPRRHRHGVGGIVLRRQRALRGAHGHPRIFSTQYAFAALDQDGTVTAWGTRPAAAPCPPGGSRASAAFSPHLGRSPRSTKTAPSRRGGSSLGGSVPSGELTGIRGSNPCSMGMFVDAGACGACPIGYASPAPNETQCWMCTGGRFADSEASISCRDCPLGYYARKAQPNCTVCSAGRYQDTKGKFSCKNCSVGKYIGDDGLNVDQHNSKVDCVSCPKLMLNEHDGASYCFVCPAGWFTQMYTTAAQLMYNCTECPVGWHQRQNRQLGCEECPSGRQALQKGSAAALCVLAELLSLRAHVEIVCKVFSRISRRSPRAKSVALGFTRRTLLRCAFLASPGSFWKSGSEVVP